MSTWIRQIHRWLSIIFTVTVIANFVAISRGEPPAWVTYSPLLPLFLLLLVACTCSHCHMPRDGAAAVVLADRRECQILNDALVMTMKKAGTP